jgi:hypothetical protein
MTMTGADCDKVMALDAQGLANAEIAAKTGVSKRTVTRMRAGQWKPSSGPSMPLLGRSPLTGVIEEHMEAGYTLDELTVLARDNDPFRQDRDEGHKLGRWPAEEDHLVPLELGGSNDITNLWPEAGKIPNPKDPVENELRRAVCDGTVSLAAAQAAVARDRMTAQAVLGLRPWTRLHGRRGRPEQPRAAGISAGRSLRQQNRTEHKKESHA